MIIMAKRNVKLFFRDRMGAFFSLMAVAIIIGLYALFLGDNFIKGVGENVQGVKVLVNSWVVAGIMAVVSVTTTLGAYGIMVDDKAKKISKDFYCAPIKRTQIAGGYIIGSCVVGLVMSAVTLVIAEIYIVSSGGEILPIADLLKVVGVMFLAVLSGSAMMLFIISFLKSQNAFAAASSIIGTLIGFFVGVYVPIGGMASSLQFIMNIFPTTHAAALFRQIMVKAPMAVSFAGAPTEAIGSFEVNMGIIVKLGENMVPVWGSILYLVATTIVFFGLSVLVMSRKSKG